MKIVFVSNFLNPHQYPVAQEMYRLTNGEYRFVELEKMPDSFRESGYPDYGNEPWIIRAWESEDLLRKTDVVVLDADVMIAGGCAAIESYIDKRLERNKLTFKYSERWLKRGLLNLLSPNIYKPVLSYHLKHRNKPYYLLCASAFAAVDAHKLGTFKNKAFKWGYFPKTNVFKINESKYSDVKNGKDVFKIMTVCRMIDWKRPEMMVEAAKFLKDNGVKFIMNMYGSGERLGLIRKLINKYSLNEMVNLCGNIPNSQIHEEMRAHHCLLFTSNQREGWGAVVNEAMANGCVVVGASKIGAIPYLIKDGENGIVFEDDCQDDLNKKLLNLANDITVCERMAERAQKTITTVWSPTEAAKRIINLAESLLNGVQTSFNDGPCSIA